MKQHLLLLVGLCFCVGALSACGEASTGGSYSGPGTVVQVNETDFKIDSSTTSFVPGKIYHFVVTNSGNTVHEFMIMPEAKGRMNGMLMGNMDKTALVALDGIQPGATRTVDYTFPVSMLNAHPEFACYLPGHYEAGMKQVVTVKN